MRYFLKCLICKQPYLEQNCPVLFEIKQLHACPGHKWQNKTSKLASYGPSAPNKPDANINRDNTAMLQLGFIVVMHI